MLPRSNHICYRKICRYSFATFSFMTLLLWNAQADAAQTVTTSLGTSYCVDSDFLPTLAAKAGELRKLAHQARLDGKLVGYISVPLSATGGGVTDINRSVSSDIKDRVELDFGGRIWMLAPGSVEASIPPVNGKTAAGPEYMYMWTQVLAGSDGLGEDFDLFYFAGPRDFWVAMKLRDASRVSQLEALADKYALQGADKRRFVTYYALRASAVSSKGAHDEWNIVRLINERRRSNPTFGVGLQIATWYDGEPVEPDDTENALSRGYEGACPQ